jgi:hypothetical protein
MRWHCELTGFTTVEAETEEGAKRKAADKPFGEWYWFVMDVEKE